ncbi:hypothetical protein ATKI12_6582 [Kitasatospora sp. Ki12]
MATSADLAALYGDLRASLLSRHFALGRYFRTNYLSLFNLLGDLSEPEAPPDNASTPRIRPSSYGSASDLLATDELQKKERWRIAKHQRENPLMFSSQMLICLSVEHYLGRVEVAPIIKCALDSIGSLYKFDKPFQGYPIRWDPVTSDLWVVARNSDGKSRIRYNYEFLLAQDRRSYLYCTPLEHPNYTRNIRDRELGRMTKGRQEAYRRGRDRSLELYRAWEPSMDEIVGLICGYDSVYRLVDDQDIKSEVQEQARWLGEYLAEHGYLLVRPCGGFTARGASGVLPALEFPWQRVFERITDQPASVYSPRVSFEGALDKAKVWDSLKGPLLNATIAGGLLNLALFVSPFTTGFLAAAGAVSGVLGGQQAALNAIISPTLLARAAILYVHRECFDVTEGEQGDFALAYLLKQLPQEARFRLWMLLSGKMSFGWPDYFPPFVALTALDDTDGVVSTAYIRFLRERSRRPELDSEKMTEDSGRDVDGYGASPFASAVAVVLGAGSEEERRLVSLLNRWHDKIQATWKGDHRLQDSDQCVDEIYRPALNYMAALALAWLHSKRQEESGNPVGSDIEFPEPPSNDLRFLDPTVPRDVLQDSSFILPKEDIFGDGIELGDVTLFGSSIFGKSDEPAPILKPSKDKVIAGGTPVTVKVTEATREVDTGIDIQPEDEIEISASGKIWAGVLFVGDNGPNGLSVLDNDLKFPVPGSHPYALTGRIGDGGPFFVGETYSILYVGPPGRLFLGINDDTPNNGSGDKKWFTCDIKVRR